MTLHPEEDARNLNNQDFVSMFELERSMKRLLIIGNELERILELGQNVKRELS